MATENAKNSEATKLRADVEALRADVTELTHALRELRATTTQESLEVRSRVHSFDSKLRSLDQELGAFRRAVAEGDPTPNGSPDIEHPGRRP
jgi:prefoldin subunit 5